MKHNQLPLIIGGSIVILLLIVVVVKLHNKTSAYHYSSKSIKEVNSMDTTKSKEILKKYKSKNLKLKRKSMKYGGTWNASPEDIFPLLCPTVEADWIPGWDCELIYTESGYAEDQCVFTTDEDNPTVGKALWIFTGYNPNEYVKFVIIKDDFIAHVKIDVVDNGNGTTSGTWNATFTAISEKGNAMIGNMPSDEERSAVLTKLISAYLANKDLTKSKELLKRFREREFKLKRKTLQYGGTFKADMDTLFPLFCPTREADWIPDWNAELLYTESGYAEDKAIFRTPNKSFTGEGLWTITGIKQNELLEFISYQKDLLTFVRLKAVDNGDGTVTATWNSTFTALTEKGNNIINSMPGADPRSKALSNMINHYLTTGKTLAVPKGMHH